MANMNVEQYTATNLQLGVDFTYWDNNTARSSGCPSSDIFAPFQWNQQPKNNHVMYVICLSITIEISNVVRYGFTSYCFCS